uniref:Lactosylceramide 4-alpha-galactosyltransferase n=1 Tax=Cacopsylla melanoneura TaxID=428564 RepID=A0A8D8LHY0_9HEMI
MHPMYLQRTFLYLLTVCILVSFLLGVQIFLSPRFLNHFIFQVKQPLRYIEYWRSGYRVQNIQCLYSQDNDKSFAYKDLTRLKVRPNSIFFLETSCKHEAGVDLSPRQACSIESAALMNPHRQLYVVIISSVGNQTRSPVIQRLYEYRNVQIVQVDLVHLFQNTPLYRFYIEDNILTSLWPLSHMSDLLRYVTLYKYGGTYLDLDFVVIKSLEHLHNYAGAESSVAVAAGVIHLDHGHWLSSAAVSELRSHFKATEWGANGPGVLTRLLKNECEYQSYSETLTRCKNFTIYPPSYFYPIHWPHWADYFNETAAAAVMTKLEPSLAVHVWNSFAKQTPVQLKSEQPYAQLARRFCPRISDLAGDTF